MCASVVEIDSSMLRDNRNNPVLRYLSECHLSTRNRVVRIRRYPDAPDYQIPLVSDYDEYRHITEMFNQVAKIHAGQVTLPRAALTQIYLIQEPPAWHACLKDAATVEDVVLVIRLFGQSSIADQLDYLNGLPVDEPYQKPMKLESARGFALFIMNNTQLPYPDIAVNPDGRVTIEWDVVGRGTLVLEFLSSELVEYLDVFQQSESARQRQYNSGVSSIDSVTDIVKPAIDKLISQ